MKNELIKLLGLDLPANATDADSDKAILAAVKTLCANAAAAAAALAEESVLTKMIADSHGALSRDAARQVLQNREAYKKSQAEASEKAKAKPAPKPKK